ncbi:facilitated trehalose transporter Tret1-like [Cylas formicarius]|uniref:facilitated trehalose transporter Tret1-like n=1 Tax=Cylas formicarius TaxID=197179 RepID=UPI002958B231|nr:facilitated trehalose transporter Tret1-like [Cylas formicarius]
MVAANYENESLGEKNLDAETFEKGIVYRPTTRNDGYLSPEKEAVPRDPWFLYFTAFLANLISFVAGIGLSWTSPVFPKLESPQTPLNSRIEILQKSWIMALLNIGEIIGPFIFGYLADKIGRKITLIVISIPMGIGLIILAFATDVRLYYAARLLHGIGIGGCFSVVTMYLAEISEQHNRGKLSCAYSLFLSFGVLYPYAIGPFLNVKVFSLSCVAPLLLFLALSPIFVPDSPLYLIRNGDLSEAENVLIKLRDNSDVRKELSEIRQFVAGNKDENTGYIHLLAAKDLRRALLVGVGLVVVTQLTGISALVGFLHSILDSAGSTIPSKYASILVGSVKFLTVFVTSAIIERLGRRFLLMMSCVGMIIALVTMGLFFSLHAGNDSGDVTVYFWWLPTTCLLLYFISFNLGVGPVSLTVMSEIFPSNVRSTASALATTLSFVAACAITFMFPIISAYLSMASTFCIFSGFCMVGLVFVYFIVPETRGKTLAEIQELLAR